MDYSGDGSGGGGSISNVLLSNAATDNTEEGEFIPLEKDDRVLWRDVFGDLRRQSEKDRIATLLNYINTDGLPEQFRRLTSDYLREMIQLVGQRLGAAPFNRHMSECADKIPERFYHINYAAYDSLKYCPACTRVVGQKYVGAVHDLVLDLFNCLDNSVRPAESNYNQRLHK